MTFAYANESGLTHTPVFRQLLLKHRTPGSHLRRSAPPGQRHRSPLAQPKDGIEGLREDMVEGVDELCPLPEAVEGEEPLAVVQADPQVLVQPLPDLLRPALVPGQVTILPHLQPPGAPVQPDVELGALLPLPGEAAVGHPQDDGVAGDLHLPVVVALAVALRAQHLPGLEAGALLLPPTDGTGAVLGFPVTL